MKKISETYIKTHLKRAMEAFHSENTDALWEQPVEKACGDEWYLDGIQRRGPKPVRMRRYIMSAAACIAVCMLSVYMVNFHTDATVYLDVNPSVMLQVNRSEKVLRAQANNADGARILKGKELKHVKLDDALHEILDEMIQCGYVSAEQNALLLSVDGQNQPRADALRERLSEELDDSLHASIGSGMVLAQTIHATEEMETLADRYQISLGKAAFLKETVDAYPQLTYEKLAGLSMSELISYLEGSGLDIPDSVNQTGSTAAPGKIENFTDDSDDLNENDRMDDSELDLPDEEDDPETPDAPDLEETDTSGEEERDEEPDSPDESDVFEDDEAEADSDEQGTLPNDAD